MERTLFLIDGNSLLNRAYYALPPLTTVRGVPTNAVYGFTTMLLRLEEDYHPSKIYVAFDVSAPTFRHEAYKDYKANRTGMPDDLKPQVDLLKQVLDAWGIKRLELAGYEADDIIGTAAKKAEALGYKVYIVTGDRDALQLISDQTTVLLTKRGIKEIEAVDRTRLYEQYQLTPEQIIDLKGLMGDSSDNIPGVPGVGEKTALKLLHKHNSIAELYQNLDQEKGKLKERLEANKEQALLSRELSAIDCQVPLEIDFDTEPERDAEQLIALFQELEFASLIERLAQDNEHLAELARQAETAEPEIQVEYSIFKPEKTDEFAADLKQTEKCGVYCSDEDLAVALGKQLWYIDPKHWNAALAVLKQLGSGLELFCSDAKRFYKLYDGNGIDLDWFKIAGDVSIAGYILDPVGSHDLSILSVRYLNLPPLSEVGPVPQQAAEKAQRVLLLGERLNAEIEAEGMAHLYQDVELPLAKVLAKMELTGIRCNPDKLKQISQELEAVLNQLTEEIYEIAGEEFNINSPKQLAVILFDKLGLPVLKRTKTGPSTSAEVLEQLSYHPIVDKLLTYRQLTKLKSTYADALVNLINPDTDRIHTTFNQTITATGRLSSANPNLQNIPIRTAEGRRIRGAFEPREGWYLLTADYSQIELRVLAHISGDPGLVEAFRSGADIHRRTAAEILQIPMEEVTDADRDSAKAINFGIIYGISSYGLAKGTKLSQAQAQQYIDSYFARYPQVKAYLDSAIAAAKTKGYVTTLLNRRRYLPEIKSKNYQRRSFAERTAMNTPIQGSAADIIKLAMLKIDQVLAEQNLKTQMLLQVHDELVFEVPPEELELAAGLVKENMESVLELKVPLKVDIKVGKDWEQVETFEVK